MTAKPAKGKLFNYRDVVVTVELPVAVCRQMIDTATALRKVAGPDSGVYWIPPNVAHLSLAFAGRVRDGLVKVLTEAWQRVAESTQPFTVGTQGLTLNTQGEGEDRATRAIWVRLADSEPLAQLRQSLAEAVESIDVGLATETYEPHIPLALADDLPDSEEFGAAFAPWQNHEFGEIPVRSLAVKIANPVDGVVQAPFTITSNLPLGSKEE